MIMINAIVGKGYVKDFGVAYIGIIPGLDDCWVYAKSIRDVESRIEYALASWFESKRNIDIEVINNSLPAGTHMSTSSEYKTKTIIQQAVDHERKLPIWAKISWLTIPMFAIDIFRSDKSVSDKISTAFTILGTLFFIYLVAVTASCIYHKLKKH